jgi:hypothetical protein
MQSRAGSRLVRWLVALVALAASAPAADGAERGRAACPHPSVTWTLKARLPIVEGDGYKGVVLPAQAGTAVLCQCSRASAGPASRYWTPAPDDIAQLESRLTAYVRANAHPHMPKQWLTLSENLRQYLGVERSGRKLIYVNFLGVNVFSLIRRPFHRPAIERAWRSTAFVMCDGGPDYFGVEYDVAARVFTRIDFNY